MRLLSRHERVYVTATLTYRGTTVEIPDVLVDTGAASTVINPSGNLMMEPLLCSDRASPSTYAKTQDGTDVQGRARSAHSDMPSANEIRRRLWLEA